MIPATRDKVLEALKKILIKKGFLTNENVLKESDILSEMGVDSLDTVELTMNLEDQFEIEVSDDEMERFKTIGNILQVLGSKINSIESKA